MTNFSSIEFLAHKYLIKNIQLACIHLLGHCKERTFHIDRLNANSKSNWNQMRLDLGFNSANYGLSFRTWLKFPTRREEETNNSISFSGRETSSCIRWLHQIKNFSVSFPPIDKLLNWSFVFSSKKNWEKSIHKYCHKTLPMYSISIQKSGNFIFSFDEILYDFPAFLTIKASHTFNGTEKESEWEEMTIKMSSKSLCCKRHKMKSSIEWTNIKCLSRLMSFFHEILLRLWKAPSMAYAREWKK